MTHVKNYGFQSLKKMWIRSFKWGTVYPCRLRCCKNIRGQSWESIRNCWLSQIRDWCPRGLADLTDSHWPPTLDSDIFAASWHTRVYSNTFKRSDSYLYGDWKPQVTAWLLTWFIFAQSTIISYYAEAFLKKNRSWLHCNWIQFAIELLYATKGLIKAYLFQE